MSKKSTNNRMSYGQYKVFDLFLFLAIMFVCEVINVFAATDWFAGSANFAISVMLLMSLIVMIRWGLVGAIFPIVDGLLYCWLMGASGELFAIYAIGNAFVAIAWIYLKLVGKARVVSKWWLTLIYAVLGYILMVIGRSTVAACYGYNFLASITEYMSVETFNLFFAAAGLLVLRRFDSMLVDQKQFLIKVTTERDEVKPAEGDYHWDGYTELNEDDLKNLAAMDEYDRQIAYNRKSLKDISDENPDEDDLSRLDE